jgi:hypothetical protein
MIALFILNKVVINMEKLKNCTFRYSSTELDMLKHISQKTGLHQQQIMRMSMQYLINNYNLIITQSLLLNTVGFKNEKEGLDK